MYIQKDHVQTRLKKQWKSWESHAYQIKKQIHSAYSYFEKQSYSQGYRQTKNMCLPDFLGIGVPQAGTTWLYQNLKCHPDIFLPQKEVRYFDAYFHRSLSSYSQKFLSGHAKIKGDISPNYCILSPERIRFITPPQNPDRKVGDEGIPASSGTLNA